MKKWYSIFVLAILAILLFFIYIKIGPPEKKEIVRVVTPPIIASLPIWVAESEGYFENNNIKIDYINIVNSRYMVAAFLSGNADVLPAVSLAELASVDSQSGTPLLKAKIFSHSRMRRDPSFEFNINS